MIKKKSDCIHCKFFRLQSISSGICRQDPGRKGNYPVVACTNTCEHWKDCGQQYFIRKGWIKKQMEAETQQ